VATVACGDPGSNHPSLCSCNTSTTTKRRRTSSPFRGRIILYNRVGKCGSTSFEKLLEQLCHVVPYTFDGSATKLQRAVNLLRAVPTAMHSQPCRVLFGHGRYTPPPPHTSYINLVREPLSRWLSLYDFYASTGLKGDHGQPTPRNATKCILAALPGTAAGACVGAWDYSISKYMLTPEEEARGQCNVALALSRFDLLLTLEQSSALMPHLLSLLVPAPPAGSSEGEDEVATNMLLDGVERYIAQGVPPAVLSHYKRSSLADEATLLLSSSLACDFAIYDAIVKVNKQRLRDASSVHPRFARLNLTLPRVSPLKGNG